MPLTRRNFLRTTTAAGLAASVSSPLTAFAQAPATFPDNFVWGAGTSAMQIEGSLLAGGGGPSIWEPFLKTHAAAVKDHSTNIVADDSYHRWADDVALLQQLKLGAYRFSISWPRVLPGGTGSVNQKGLEYYDRLIDALLAAKVTPYVTIFHFDYPEALEKRGGWLNPDSSSWFADYAKLLSTRFSDRVTHWLTINEPNIFWSLSAELGMMPPARKHTPLELVTGANNILLAHGKAVQAVRAAATQPVEMSLPFAGILKLPATNSEADVDAARAASFQVEKTALAPGMPGASFLNAAWWLDPIYLGHYPEQGLQFFGSAAKSLSAADMDIIHRPLDFLAVNLYTAARVQADKHGKPVAVADGPNVKHTSYNWAVTPDLLYWGPKFLHERYNQPICITENGSSWKDTLAADGKVHDPDRTQTLDAYLSAYRRASVEGIPLKGYFYWSLLDNWEFTQGYEQRFGLIYVDYANKQKRIIKDSGLRYRDIVTSKGGRLA